MIERDPPRLSVAHQCDLLGLARSTLYYQPVEANVQDLTLMRRLDEQYMRRPFYGVRRMTRWLRGEGHSVNPKHVRRLLRTMGLEAVYPKPRLSQAAPGHRIYPYLLRGMTIGRPNQVWSTDITYIRLAHGFVYLVAVLDWFSRYVLAWSVSNTLEGGFCVETLRQALARYGHPEIFNSDQGVQFTSEAFTGVLASAGVAISMDGRGRALDNVFVERRWRQHQGRRRGAQPSVPAAGR